MYLSFFITETTPVLDEIRQVLEEVGFEDIKTRGEIEKSRIVLFNGRKENNFSYSAHKLVRKAPDNINNRPFLVRVGSKWTIQGLGQILESYSRFVLPHMSALHFPKEEDYLKSADDKKFLMRLTGIKQALINCDKTTKEEVEKFAEISSEINGKSLGEVKREIFYFFLQTGRINLPWGNPPTSEKSKDLLIEWIKMANSAYPRDKSTSFQARKDLAKIRRLKNLSALKLT